jgi:hypothetical protein
VKITYLELYNEELTDLLVDATNEQQEKIKIYEDKDKVHCQLLLIHVNVSLLFVDKHNRRCHWSSCWNTVRCLQSSSQRFTTTANSWNIDECIVKVNFSSLSMCCLSDTHENIYSREKQHSQLDIVARPFWSIDAILCLFVFLLSFYSYITCDRCHASIEYSFCWFLAVRIQYLQWR